VQGAELLGSDTLARMNKRPGQPRVTIETGYCSFCDRTRNLRHEERLLGALVRTVVTCESCHRTLSSSMGVATAEERSEHAVEEATASPVDEAGGAAVGEGATTSPADGDLKAAPEDPAATPTPKAKAADSKSPKSRGRSQRSK
jgi:hypothetical protein